MADDPRTGREIREKNPSLAAFLAIFPGMGAVYNGNILKGVTYLLIFGVLIALTSNADGSDATVFGLMIAGFYIYQIVDSYNEAARLNRGGAAAAGSERGEDLSLFSAIVVLAIGVLFQLVNFDVLTFRQVSRLWPLALIAFGIKIVFDYYKREEKHDGKH